MSDFELNDIEFGAAAQGAPKPKAPIETAPVEVSPALEEAPRARAAKKPIGPQLAIGILTFTTVLFAFLWLRTLTIDFDPLPDVDPIDGSYVAIFYDDDEKASYTDEQREALDSAAIRKYLDDNATQALKLDVDQTRDLSGLPDVFSEMAAQSRQSLPWMVIRSGRRVVSEPITTPDAMLRTLKRYLE